MEDREMNLPVVTYDEWLERRGGWFAAYPPPFEHEVYGVTEPRIVLCKKCHKERVWDT